MWTTARDAARLRSLAGIAGMSLGDFVVRLMESAPTTQPRYDLREFARISEVLAALDDMPREFRSEAAQMRKLAGMLRHAFVEFEAGAVPSRKPLLDALEAVRNAADSLEGSAAAAELAAAPVRDDLRKISSACCGRLESE